MGATSFAGRRIFGAFSRRVFAGVLVVGFGRVFGLKISRLEFHDFKFLSVFNLRLVSLDLFTGFPNILGLIFFDPFASFTDRESG